jgi:FKBP-type peptidyl-prolyl cis-trans isomerase FklB
LGNWEKEHILMDLKRQTTPWSLMAGVVVGAAFLVGLPGCQPSAPASSEGLAEDASSTQIEEEAQSSLAAVQGKQEQTMPDSSDDSPGAETDFLAENGKREGVTTTASGLQYEILVAGDGATPGIADTVTTHYQGKLIDGSVFDSSLSRSPASFPLNRVISGWTEALQLMPVGSKWRLFIPPELAYGSRGVPGIPSNSTLIFEVELISIEDAG